MNPTFLQTPIDYLKGVGPNRADLLRSELGVHTYQDLIHLFPNRYIDKTRYHKIQELERTNAEVQIVGKITSLKMIEGKGRRLVATFTDGLGTMELVWFRGHKWIRESIRLHTPYVIFGKTTYYNGSFSMPHPEMELLTDHEKNIRTAMQPVYPSTEKLTNRGVTNKAVNTMMQSLFNECMPHLYESLSQPIIASLKLMGKKDALFNIHFPQSHEALAKAQYRLKFEEFFYIQLQLAFKNINHKKKIKGYPFDKVGPLFTDFYKHHLPFKLTGAQKKVLKEIRYDLGTNAQMNRLLQGDVGSGKTIVAFMSMLIALDNGFQACLMAPTAILAVQHYQGLQEFCEALGLKIALLQGATKTSERKVIHSNLESGQLHILIGTHALLEDRVLFKNLGLAIIDEQHRFGVKQRSKLWHKNEYPPHILVMTATPIPRTLAMTVYGDLDVSVIDELPPGRKMIKTVHRYDSNRLKVFRFIRDEIKLGRQVYIVYPLIQESEAMDYKDLMDGYESISREFPKPQYQISIVHGQMKPEDKEFEMQRFIKGETHIMVATTVIEVGVNVPNASVMIIESAERFGLSQLHQLRGRVGRGAEQSYCILMTSHKLSSDSKVRLETMTRTNDGFEIAEVDLKLRGPGDITGTQQSGILNLKIGDIIRDNDILKIARSYALNVVREDPQFTKEENQIVRFMYAQMMKFKNIWSYIS